jgi:hypothetical protein
MGTFREDESKAEEILAKELAGDPSKDVLELGSVRRDTKGFGSFSWDGGIGRQN